MPKKEGLRRRKDKKEKDKKVQSQTVEKSKPTNTKTTTTVEVGLPTDETLKETFFKHHLVRVAPYVVIPYIIYQLIYFLTLRHPEYVSSGTLGLINQRPALKPHDVRQVLILGPEFPENRYVTAGMVSPLKLEIVYEAFDAYNYFCRDGSVSWYQLMRFMDPVVVQSQENNSTLAAWKELCMDRNHAMIKLFHPKEYGMTSCSSYEKWSKCWAKECFNLVTNLWACEKDDTRDCPQRFSRILHQVRHPLRTIEALNASVCPNPQLKDSFMAVVRGFFPERDWKSMSCLNAMAWYTVDFHMLLIQAREEGTIHGMFQIENTSPCEVAALAGFQDPESSLYAPNVEKTTRLCRNDDVDRGNLDAMSQDLFAKVKTTNKGDDIPGLTPVSLHELAGDNRLAKDVQNLITLLGYDKEGDGEFL
jgi:hypothetical protein